jgi:hypothetical protein
MNELEREPALRAPSASELCVKSSADVICEGTVVLKGLPLDHVRANCMGKYTKKERTINGRSSYVGGRDGEMALYFDEIVWVVTTEDAVGDGTFFMYTKDFALTPDRIKASWMVNQSHQSAPSLRVCKYRGRESVLEVSGLPSTHHSSDHMGQYTRQPCSQHEKPIYMGSKRVDGMAIWFCKDYQLWCVGLQKHIGTHISSISVKGCAHTPDAVQSVWTAETSAEYDDRVQICGASKQRSSSATANQAQQLSSAPPKLAIVGTEMEGLNLGGVYTNQQRKVGSRVAYQGGVKGDQAIWYLKDCGGGWIVGHTENIVTGSCFMNVPSPAITPNEITELWEVPSFEPCSSVRVTKSKKKHTKVIEVKGVLMDNVNAMQLNGKYRQSSRVVGSRPTFKGGQDGKQVIWYDERHGKWRCANQELEGKGINGLLMEATDTAATPNAVKAVWHICTTFKPSLYPNVIVPSVEAAEAEVPRLLQLKMYELVVAQQKRCLRCGHEYTAQSEVTFHTECMHHHCVCCGEELGDDGCAVCAEEAGE